MSAQPLSTVKQALLLRLQEVLIPELVKMVEALPDDLVAFPSVEVQVRNAMMELAGKLLGLWTETADRRIDRPKCLACNMPMRHKGIIATQVVSTVGPVVFRRPRWRCEACAQERYPHDDVLRFGKHGITWPLARVCGRLAADIPSFDLARETLQEDYGVHLATETVRIVAEEAGQKVIDQEDERRRAVAERQADLPQSSHQPDKAYLHADGTMIHSEGDWHEIRVNTVVTEDREGIKRECHSQARFLPPDEIGWLLVMMARSVGYQNARLQAFIADGATWLWRLQEQYFGGAIAILDWYHLAEKVHTSAKGYFGDVTVQAQEWTERIKDALWNGRSPEVLAEVREMEKQTRSPSRKEAIHALRTYLENQADHIDYPRYRALGLSIGSGPVEAQCKTLVGGRCKQAGMRDWTNEGAEGVLRMRAARQDDSFDGMWKSNLKLAA